MFHVVLLEPEIPPNTGNIIRLCANTGAILHLVQPLGFELDDRRLRRAGLDYHEWAKVKVHPSLEHFLDKTQPRQLWACSTRGQQPYDKANFHPGDALLFGPETRGLPRELLETLLSRQVLRIPMEPTSRSLNLSNAVAVVLYEAWRQQGFAKKSKPATQKT
ncbi:tRNA (uridine(34)/cytosine(34)/5-carboxymethylaminomethyluridine(34)-2'-O)-methyltransferase TrmL [Nitrosococcus oceani]|uniref:tRNA (cytidine(34)-2'-O)-methyltransferase n=2 Tax=Nitrosococcus oceani TaxID=1229 RepID=Q3J7C6_NITOC|nr:tRNA (uridine(34)/cytosine(34)/5-carboxymethylaminomethyluridine(34)-2'-O)-methyltransferase TrmL [Nitrosococcus oceani]KFI18298.1 rRNA methylase [Nitrosococcus oceani C-27]ABA59270.1 RNA methyltransferase TrmH, group 2 [Nitrosococcus oceani ATCC 19707]EDZ65853.1 RNA methyltransferase, TrmH family, group 2 [Nitrosococcus oceani AFC27]KFI21476.1 rRNA methylase [Nitrosococcus oceani]GEM21095.1 tRNA (uridine(34)/cytosine(34)/5-carboxymethylaminomethyluridine(34)-2'-O)-methyltransferase TrmL [N